jgi:hypothetical protein
MEGTRLRPTAYGRGSELTQSANSGRSRRRAIRRLGASFGRAAQVDVVALDGACVQPFTLD